MKNILQICLQNVRQVAAFVQTFIKVVWKKFEEDFNDESGDDGNRTRNFRRDRAVL